MAGFLVIIAIVLLTLYFTGFTRFADFSFNTRSMEFNPSGYDLQEMQFYEGMRYPDKTISYEIEDLCSVQKKAEMKDAFDLLGNLTVLDFYPVKTNSEILILCDTKQQLSESGAFIAGEGGPVNITTSGKYNVIRKGKILLIRDSDCEKPNVAIHELIHALGFDHSTSTGNIMYNFSECSQRVDSQLIRAINELYLQDSLPDLVITESGYIEHENYLDLNISVRNEGLKISEDFDVGVFGTSELIKTIDFDKLDIGHGRGLILRNIDVLGKDIDSLSLEINYAGQESNKTNNVLVLR